MLAAVLTSLLAAVAPSAASTSWVGAYRLGPRAPVQIAFVHRPGQVNVALGVGHADLQSVRARGFRFTLPGAPPLVFTGRLARGRVTGTVRQGSARGRFQAHRGAAPGLSARGFYATGPRTYAVVDDPYGPERLVDVDSGEVHALYPSGSRFVVGSGFATRAPEAGAARFGATGATIAGAPATRIAQRQLEVRFRSGNVTLSGTLTIPPSAGAHPAVSWVPGSGPTTRAYLPDLQALLLRNGVAVLAYDKRGIGQSGGSYPGESPTAGTIDALARDASAAVHFLAAQPEIDRARVGLAGHSQAGWIMPLAASRDRAMRFLISFSGPAATAGENDAYQNLTGQGESPPRLTPDQIDAEVARAGRSGVDPVPWIKATKIPMLWLYGGLDQHIPARLSMRRLEPVAAEAGREIEVEVFPNANHALVETRTGLTSEMLRSNRFAPGLFPAVRAWLTAHRFRS